MRKIGEAEARPGNPLVSLADSLCATLWFTQNSQRFRAITANPGRRRFLFSPKPVVKSPPNVAPPPVPHVKGFADHHSQLQHMQVSNGRVVWDR